MIVLCPVATGGTQVDDSPDWSLSTEQLVPVPQIESAVPFVVLYATVAPLTGVTPSDATTCTRIGFAACDPTGVAGSEPCSRRS